MTKLLRELFDLSGRVALVTGGSRGLGLQIAEALGEYGANVILAARKAEELKAAVEQLNAMGISANSIVADLRSEEAANALADAVRERVGRLDILVNNAGATWGAPAEDYPASAWNKVMDVNLTAPFFLSKAAARLFFIPQHGGVIVNVASVEGYMAHPPSRVGTVAYNASKGAMINMTRALAAEWGSRNIRVNALAPGYFPTKMTHGTLEKIHDEVIAGTPLGKLGSDFDLKGAALLLASDAGGQITGQVIAVEGGASII
ncbi:MAG TPA: SDR family oxidoreductase [Rhizomicrobium sp.]|nr:SDR family oxidoreductase [Rhizomicrobium sp.]